MQKPDLEEPPNEQPKKSSLRSWLFFVGKIVVLLLVLAGMAHATWKAVNSFDEKELSIYDLNFAWVAAAGGLYLLGMAPSLIFWQRTLQYMGQPVSLWDSLRAFYVSQLGKYIPGKAMVVVIRATALPAGADRVVGAVSVFVETLTMMAVGAAVSAVIIVAAIGIGVIENLSSIEQAWLIALAVGLMLAAGVPTFPPLFRRIVKMLQVKRASGNIDHALQGVNFRLIAEGWGLCTIGWTIMGLALYASVQAIPGGEYDSGLSLLLIYIAAIALSVVAGFLSMLPGGFGVRDYVMFTLLQPFVGDMKAVFGVIVMRLASLLAEASAGGLLYLLGMLPKRRVGETTSEEPPATEERNHEPETT